MAAYAFVTTWSIRAPLDPVWNAIFHSERWPAWWIGLKRVDELAPGDATGVGCVRRFTWQGQLPYTLRVTMHVIRVEPMAVVESLASGELCGRGVWRFSAGREETTVRYEWDVSTTKRWMNRLAPIARPLFRWNHDVVMRGGERGLRRLLEPTP